ncbi:HAMP domain-containing sensor histidine kinase [Nodosilinea sp. E11]|uniref:sensor histidine kinase n=1 Tax=Nodosilinea sp. E11 TaxID=3037479 RepID=UPI0029345181|nr:HAMP domain-containing sensor histidine kinase [Nodosilinea sp. E11]WOD38738.1 HAMP domain-containing sensor histidine kinase [Nodosilinea sp. E11]
MAKVSLRSRLFLSHLAVMGIGILTLAIIGRLYTPRLFVISLERYENGVLSVQRRTQLVKGFEAAWSRGMLWAILVGGSTSGGLSYLVSRRIIRPLDQMTEVTRSFAAGHLNERVPPSEILEIQRLASSFNRMAADLEGVEEHRRELIGDLTHELRTPLTIIHGYLEGLADGTVTPEPELYQRLAGETTRLQRLVNDLQELSKLEAGYLPIQAQSVNLCPLLTALVRPFADQFVSTDRVVITLQCEPDLPLAYADPSRIEQIVINLLGNALRYTEKGAVTVNAWAQTGRIYVSVADTGIGIAEEDVPYVFERFWRADRSRNRSSGGTGLGLTICRRLVEVQGGKIEVKSEIGQGSEFTFWLPQAKSS